jgi:prepilin-type N-terminal cleavage/methylation domain-containing protein
MNYRGLMQTSSNKGFTLAELLVGMVISTITLGLAFAAFESASKSYSNDKVRVDTGQSLTAVLDLIGTDIKQAGEQIGNSSFPTIKISDGGKTITIRKALSDALPLCQSLSATDPLLTTANTTTNVLISDGSIPTATAAGCSSVVPPALPASVSDWQTARTELGGTGRVALVKQNGQTKILDYTGEVQDSDYTTSKKYRLSLKNTQLTDISGANISPATIENPVTTAVVSYAAGDSLYLIEERTYRYHINPTDSQDVRLLLRVNGGSEQILIAGLKPNNGSSNDGFSVAANVTSPASPSPTIVSETTFPNPSPTSNPNINWKKIVGVNVSLEVNPPSTCPSPPTNIDGCRPEDFRTSGTFYPRNVMSK